MIGSPFAGDRMLLVYHQRTRFRLGFQRQRYVNSHLVTIEVRRYMPHKPAGELDNCRSNTGSNARIPGAVQCWCTVQQYRVFADNFVRISQTTASCRSASFLDFDGGGQATQFQLAVDEQFEQFQCHFLRQAALMQTRVWTYGDYRTTG